jgi:hypothetical protein
LSITQAVSPPPDGGYPRGNTAEGQNALFSLTTGTYNTAVGLFSLESNATGNFNTAIGPERSLQPLRTKILLLGRYSATPPARPTPPMGYFALFNNTEGSNSTADGPEALFTNETGQGNTAAGAQALFFNDGGPC